MVERKIPKVKGAKDTGMYSQQAVVAVASELAGYALDDVYRFPIRSEAIEKLKDLLPKGTATISLGKGSPAERTLTLRKILSLDRLWSEKAKRIKLARWAATDWGRVDRRAKNNKRLTELVDMADGAHAGRGRFQLDRVATWSKYLAFRYPRERAIYDARTIFSLNWLLQRTNATQFFPFPLSENRLLGALDYRTWLSARVLGLNTVQTILEKDIADRDESDDRSFAVGNCMKRLCGTSRNPYEDYCELLKRVGAVCFDDDKWGLTRVEMVLFGIATKSIATDVFRTIFGSDTSTTAQQ